MAHAQNLGYYTWGASKSEHKFEFGRFNEYQGQVYGSDEGWVVNYFSPTGAGDYFYLKSGQDLIELLNGIDPNY